MRAINSRGLRELLPDFKATYRYPAGEKARLCACFFLCFVAASFPNAPSQASHIGNAPFVADPALHGIDKTPPPAPTLALEGIWRGRGPTPLSDRHFKGGSTDGAISVVVSFPGQSALRDRFGYVFHRVDGLMPDDLVLPTGAWSPYNERLNLRWNDRPFWYQEPFSFRMYVTAVDSAGNESPASNVVLIADDGKQSDEFDRIMERKRKHYRNYMMSGVFDGRWTGRDENGVVVSLVIREGAFEFSTEDSSAVGFVGAQRSDGSDTIEFEIAGREFPNWCFGIFEIRNHWLRICLAPPGALRPSSFTPGPKAHVYSLGRRSR